MDSKRGVEEIKKILAESKEKNPFLWVFLFGSPDPEIGVYDVFNNKLLQVRYSIGNVLKFRRRKWKMIEAMGSISKEELAGLYQDQSGEISESLLSLLKAKRK